MNKQKNTKRCGCCAFLIGEDMYGYGSCPFDFGELKHCEMAACQNHINKDKVRQSAAILAQYKRYVHAAHGKDYNVRQPKMADFDSDKSIDEAIDTITRYVNVITKKV